MNKLLSAALIAFLCFFIGSCKPNRLITGDMNYSTPPEDERATYLVMTDGTRIDGDHLEQKTVPFVGREYVTFDGKKYPIKETKGYMLHGFYYGGNGTIFMKRIVHGKINIYVKRRVDRDLSKPSGVDGYHYGVTTYHYYQLGENGKIKPLSSYNAMRELVAGCPAAAAMANISNAQLKKAIKSDRNYINSIFETYNRECR